MSNPQLPSNYGQLAYEHTRFIMETIGGRLSCSLEEQRAAEYVTGQLKRLRAAQVEVEPFRAARSTYWPPALAFAVALAGVLAALLAGNRWSLLLGALLSMLAVWGLWNEFDLNPNWLRRFTPFGDSQNVIGVVLPAQVVQQRVVVLAHLDTHRAPLYTSTATWQKLFNLLLLLAFMSMVLGGAAFLLGFLLDLEWARWAGLAAAPMLVFALAITIQAHNAPVSPGANDNTASVGVSLALAERLSAEPPAHVETWLVFTGCEETGAYGMSAFLDAHAAELGPDTTYLVLEQIGTGHPMLVTAEGLIIKRPMPEQALSLGRQAGAALTGWQLTEIVGGAYSDALPAIKRGLTALTVTGNQAAVGESSHWHQLSDTMEHIYPESLQQAFDLALVLIRQLDHSPEAEASPA